MLDRTSSQTPQQVHDTRVENALSIIGKALIGIAVIWSVLLAYHGAWKFIWLEVFLMFVGATTLILNAKKFTRSGVYLLLSSLFSCTLVLCLYLDLPNDIAPRTAQNYFLSIGFLSYWLLLSEHKMIRFSIFLLCVVAFILFSSSLIGFPLEGLGSTDAGRVIGAWVNSILATVLVGLVVYVFYSDYSLRTQVEKDLSLALPRDQLELYYQVQMGESGAVQGAEVLVRWNHPQLGLVPPNEFIPLAEKNGLIVSLGRQVLLKTCEQIAKWSADPLTADLTLSVNVSVQEINEGDFVDQVIDAIKQTGIDASQLMLEITENVLILNAEETIKKMQVLKAHGVTFSLDDFGTGNTHWELIHSNLIDIIKIAAHKHKGDNRNKILRALSGFSNSLQLKTVFEGIETKQDLINAQEMGATHFQGWYFNQWKQMYS